jgi:hypothetical protein
MVYVLILILVYILVVIMENLETDINVLKVFLIIKIIIILYTYL